MDNYMKLEIAAISKNEGFARSAVAAFALELNPSLTELSDIKTAVSEAVTNAIIHGYGEKGGAVILEGKRDNLTVTFTISDKGKGIEDVELARTPLYTGAEGSERSGMGFTVMEAFMDSVLVESAKDKGTKVVMTKTLSGGDKSNEQ